MKRSGWWRVPGRHAARFLHSYPANKLGGGGLLLLAPLSKLHPEEVPQSFCTATLSSAMTNVVTGVDSGRGARLYICVFHRLSPKCQILRLNRPLLRNYLWCFCTFLSLPTDKPNYQLSGCVPR